MDAVEIVDGDRAAYHAAASIASNFLITLEAAAERLAASAGADRRLLVPLVRATVENWATVGPERALTGPVARGDEGTVARQRAAVAERAPDLLPLFDALVQATRELAEAGNAPTSTGSQPHMRTIRTVAELRAALAHPAARAATIGLVPTMGAFHEGHLSLIRRARAECDVVVVSLFVNPKQFNDPGDLSAYPREESRDAALAADLGVDFLFTPSPRRSIPPVSRRPSRSPASPSGSRARTAGERTSTGVTTVVTKLFNMVAPDVAYFGQKDAQQAVVVKRLVRDLDLPVQIEVCPTIREPDGLAMSSRNVHLSPADRSGRWLFSARCTRSAQSIAAGERDPEAAIAAGLDELSAVEIEPDYLELVATDTLAPRAADRRRCPRRGRRAGRRHPTDRQPHHQAREHQTRPRGGDPCRGANRVRRRSECLKSPTCPSPRTSTTRCR